MIRLFNINSTNAGALTPAARVPGFKAMRLPDPRVYDLEAKLIANALLRTGDQPPRSLFVVDARGAINNRRLRVKGALNLESIRFALPLTLMCCEFENEIELTDARLGALDLRGSTFPGLRAAGAQFDGSLDLTNVESAGTISLRDATIVGSLVASGARVERHSTAKSALTVNGARIGADVFLTTREDRPFTSMGTVNFIGATVGGDFYAGGARLDGAEANALSLVRAKISGGVFIGIDISRRTEAVGPVHLGGATVGGDLNASGAHLDGRGGAALNFDSAKITGDVFLGVRGGHRFESSGAVAFLGAAIGGDVSFSGARLERNASRSALTFDRAEIKGGVFLDANGDQSFEAIGNVRFVGATIGGSLTASGARLDGIEEDALSFARARIGGGVFFSVRDNARFESLGTVNFQGATIEGSITASGALMNGRADDAINFGGANVSGSVRLGSGNGHRFQASGGVGFLGATIGGDFFADGAHLVGKQGGLALWFDRAAIRGGVFLGVAGDQRFETSGTVRFVGATIGAGLNASGAHLDGLGAEALSFARADIRGGVFLSIGDGHRFEAFGPVSFDSATIGGGVDASGALLDGKGRNSLSLAGATIRRDVFLSSDHDKRFEASGNVEFGGANFGGVLDMSGASFSGLVNAQGATVHQETFIQRETRFNGGLNLTNAHLNSIHEDATCWPKHGGLRLEGLTYSRFIGGAATAKARLNWIKRQPKEMWSGANILPHPFFELARVLTSMGRRSDARDVLFELERLRHAAELTTFSAIPAAVLLVMALGSILLNNASLALTTVLAAAVVDASVAAMNVIAEKSVRLPAFQGFRWLVGFPLNWFAGYGYRPVLALSWLLALFLASTLVFDLAHARGVILSAPDKVAQMDGGFKNLRASNSTQPLEGYPSFHPSIYAMNLLIPAIDLEQVSYWQPIEANQLSNCRSQNDQSPDRQSNTACRANSLRSLDKHWLFAPWSGPLALTDAARKTAQPWVEHALDAGLARWWMWGEILFGALLAIIAIAAFSGLLTRRDEM